MNRIEDKIITYLKKPTNRINSPSRISRELGHSVCAVFKAICKLEKEKKVKRERADRKSFSIILL